MCRCCPRWCRRLTWLSKALHIRAVLHNRCSGRFITCAAPPFLGLRCAGPMLVAVIRIVAAWCCCSPFALVLQPCTAADPAGACSAAGASCSARVLLVGCSLYPAAYAPDACSSLNCIICLSTAFVVASCTLPDAYWLPSSMPSSFWLHPTIHGASRSPRASLPDD